MSMLLPFVADVTALPAAPRVEGGASTADVARFGAALEQALLAASLASVPRPPQAITPLVDLAASLAEFAGDAVMDDAEPVAASEALVAVDAPAGEEMPEVSAQVQAPTAATTEATGTTAIATASPSVPHEDAVADHSADALRVSHHDTAAGHSVDAPAPGVDAPILALPSAPLDASESLAPRRKREPKVDAALASAEAKLGKEDADVTLRRDAVATTPRESDAVRHEQLAEALPRDDAGQAEAKQPEQSLDPLLALMSPMPQPVLLPEPIAAPVKAASEAQTEHSVDKSVGESSAESPSMAAPMTQSETRQTIQTSEPAPAFTGETQTDATATPSVRKSTEPLTERETPSVGEQVSARPKQPAPAPAPASDSLPAASLPAGVRVLELHAQQARRDAMVTAPQRPKRTEAPRTTAEAMGALTTATEMPAVAVDAIEQLRRPIPREGSFELPSAASTDTEVPRLTLASSGEQGAHDAMTDEQAPAAQAVPIGNTVSAGADSFESALAGVRSQDAPRMPSASAVSSATIAAPAASTPTEPTLMPKLGTERISVRLGDDVGAPVVRISIRGDAVDARIITPDNGLAQNLGSHTRELAAALEARGFESAKVQVRGTASAHEGFGAAQVAGSSVTEARDPQQSRNDEQRRPQDERAQTQRDERSDARQQQKKTPRRFRLEDDETA